MKTTKILLLAVLVLFVGVANAQTKTQPKKKPVKKTAVKTAGKLRKPVVRKKTVVAAPVVLPEEKLTGPRVKITTSLGDIIVRLYDKTPQHRDNFIKLVKEHFYDSLLFHRVINSFMIQGGDPTSKNAQAGIMLGSGGVGYTIPAEFDTLLYHKKGALAAARDNNPAKASSGCQFYIVQGKKISDGELDMIQQQSGVAFSPAKRMTYKMNGGTPFLDMNYTVFGEVESGIEVVDKIAQEQVDSNNRPLTDMSMKMEVLEEEIK